MSDVAIRVENLSKQYQIGQLHHRHDMLRDAIMSGLNHLRRNRPISSQYIESLTTIWALKDISFEVKRGEVVGIIGRNGAGKSTLLKILSRITEPTIGRAEIHGRVGSLLEVGTGFHPELTGRENIYLNGAILGMRRAEIEHQFDEIVAFAEIEKFLDTPVKRYSSGMYVRLAFAVAAHLEPEILLVDEVLAVGDVKFQDKCMGKMHDVAIGGRTVLFVSHNMGSISQLCNKTVWIDSGKIRSIGPSDTIIEKYLKGTMPPGEFDPQRIYRTGTNKARFVDVQITGINGRPTSTALMGKPLIVNMIIQSQNCEYLQLAIVINDNYGRTVLHATDQDDSFQAELVNGIAHVEVKIPVVQLYPGQYTLGVWCGYENEDYDFIKECLSFHVSQASQSQRVTEMRPGQAVFFTQTIWSNFDRSKPNE